MHRFVVARNFVASLAAMGVVAMSANAMASGFSSARLGGLHGNPLSFSPTSIYWNPGAMGMVEGTQIYLDLTTALRTASYTRSETGMTDPDSVAVNTGRNTLGIKNNFNLVNSPAVALTTDFGGSNVVLGLGFYVPFGGQAVWGKTDTPAGYEVGADGPQRWYTIDGVIRQLTGSAGIAARTNDGRFSVGMTLNLNVFQLDTIRARNSDGSDTVVEDGHIIEGRSRLDVSSVDMGIGLGAIWQSRNDRVVLGGSWQSAPNISGRQTLTGNLTNQFGPGEPSTSKVAVLQQMPQTFRLGAGLRFIDNTDEENPVIRGELRLSGELTTWNNMKSQCIINEAGLDDRHITDICRYAENGMTYQDPMIIQNLVRDWNMGWGVKLGGSYYLNPRIELGGAVGFDANAIPDHTLDPALMDMNKIAIDLGGSFQLAKWLALNLQFSDVIYLSRDTRGNPTLTDMRPESEPGNSQNVQPTSAGKYTQNIFITNVGLNFKF